jgi:hypothetical protein
MRRRPCGHDEAHGLAHVPAIVTPVRRLALNSGVDLRWADGGGSSGRMERESPREGTRPTASTSRAERADIPIDTPCVRPLEQTTAKILTPPKLTSRISSPARPTSDTTASL